MSNFVRITEAASLGFHAMARLAAEPGKRYTSAELAELLGGASEHHLAKVMPKLVKADMVRVTKGWGGGFELRTPAESIALLAIYETIEGPVREPRCLLGQENCDGTQCMLGEYLMDVDAGIRKFLAGTTLSQLVQSLKPRSLGSCLRACY
jgi:Rrf2 family protein